MQFPLKLPFSCLPWMLFNSWLICFLLESSFPSTTLSFFFGITCYPLEPSFPNLASVLYLFSDFLLRMCILDCFGVFVFALRRLAFLLSLQFHTFLCCCMLEWWLTVFCVVSRPCTMFCLLTIQMRMREVAICYNLI